MKRLSLLFSIAAIQYSAQAQTGNVGIGTAIPSNKLTVSAAADPARLIGLQAPATYKGTLVADATGVVKLRDANSISAVRASGSITYTNNNTVYNSNVSGAPAEQFDNLNEFSGNVFTASQTGLYQVTFTINGDQRASTNDSGDGYQLFTQITGPAGTVRATGKVNIPEVSGVPNQETVAASDLVKLTAGQTLVFTTLVYGSTNGNTATYTILINRVD
jgi:hypothetical protein